MEKLIIVIEKTNTGFSSYIKDIPGLVSVGDTITEIKENMKEVITMAVECRKEDGKDYTDLQREVSYAIDLEQFFEYYKVLNKSAFAEYIGINPSLFRQYTKGLAPLSSDRMKEIMQGLQKLAKDLERVVLV